MLYNLTFLLLIGGDICYFPVIQLVNFVVEAPVQHPHYENTIYISKTEKKKRVKKKAQ